MADMRKEFPSQTENRKQWIIDVVRENQEDVLGILGALLDDPQDIGWAKVTVADMHKSDRDALLLPNGILTDEQLELLQS
jgi:hypothetical protein